MSMSRTFVFQRQSHSDELFENDYRSISYGGRMIVMSNMKNK